MNGHALLLIIVVLVLMFAGARCDLEHATRTQTPPDRAEPAP